MGESGPGVLLRGEAATWQDSTWAGLQQILSIAGKAVDEVACAGMGHVGKQCALMHDWGAW